jgi:hypothetical protein
LNEEKADHPMMTHIMKWAAITTLLLAVLLRVASSQVLVAIVVCVSAVLLVRQAIRAGKYSWAVVFVAIAVLFNPIVPIALLW